MWHRFNIWDEWKAWTRFQALVDYALETSATLWKALPVKDRDHVTLQRDHGGSRFSCLGSHFLPVLEDRHTISTLLILSSWALIEGHVDEVLTFMVSGGVTTIPLVNDVRAGTQTPQAFRSGGIEAWGTALLTALGRDWTHVHDGLAGIVEVSSVRNALAHGTRIVTQPMLNRVGAVGAVLPWPLGGSIQLDLTKTRLYRDRLRSFARVIGSSAAFHIP